MAAPKLHTVADIIDDMDADKAAGIGHNGGPALTPLEASTQALADLKVEATNWLDGAAIENEAQAADVAKLVDKARKVETEADAARAAEKKPHDDAAAAVQLRWKKPIVDEANRIFKVAKALSTAWLLKLDAEQRERERLALVAAEEAAAAAITASRAAAVSTNLDDHDKADALLEQSKAAASELRQASNAKPQAFGLGRALGLKTYWSAKVTDRRKALNHYIVQQPGEFDALIQTLADRDAKGDRGDVPGVEYVSERRA